MHWIDRDSFLPRLMDIRVYVKIRQASRMLNHKTDIHACFIKGTHYHVDNWIDWESRGGFHFALLSRTFPRPLLMIGTLHQFNIKVWTYIFHNAFEDTSIMTRKS